MKSSGFHLLICLLSLPFALKAQNHSGVLDHKKHKIVIQFNEGDSISQNRVVLQAAHIKESWPNAQVEVVCLAGGIDLLIKAYSKAGAAVAEWSKRGIVFAACNHSMNSRKVTKADLLDEAIVVPSAVIELAMKQEQGWAYFRGGR